MKQIWDSMAEIIASVTGPYSLMAFILLCIIIVTIYNKRISTRIFWGVIIIFVMLFLIIFFKDNMPNLPSISSKSLLNEEFNDNSLEWNIGSRNRTTSEIKDGYFHFSSNSDTWYPLSIPYDKLLQHKEIEILTKFKIEELKEGGFGGIDWNMDDQQNRMSLYINNNGLFIGIKEGNSELKPLLNWAKNLNVLKKNFNEVKIKIRNNKIEFFINEALISDLEYKGVLGNRIGFSIKNSKILVDFLRIKVI